MAGFAFGFTVIFVCGDNFLSPVFYMLYKSVDNTIVPQYLPHTLPTLADWNVEIRPCRQITLLPVCWRTLNRC